MEKQVTWTCQACGMGHDVEYATDKRYLHCDACGQTHLVTGLHVNGEPILHKVANKGKEMLK